MKPLTISAVGMISGLAKGAEANAAAMRCQYDCFAETQFLTPQNSERLIGAAIPYSQNVFGISKLVQICSDALEDLFSQTNAQCSASLPVLLCLPESTRPDWDTEKVHQFYELLTQNLELDNPYNLMIQQGRVSLVTAFEKARELIYSKKSDGVIILGIDSLLNALAIQHFGKPPHEYRNRLLTQKNSDAFIPGEAAAACFVTKPQLTGKELILQGFGKGLEEATIYSRKPLNGIGLTQAIYSASNDAQLSADETGFRIVGLTGESYFFKEAALILPRVLKTVRPVYDFWHPSDCIGECGAVNGLAILVMAYWASKKNYLPHDTALCHLSNDDEQRAAFILKST